MNRLKHEAVFEVLWSGYIYKKNLLNHSSSCQDEARCLLASNAVTSASSEVKCRIFEPDKRVSDGTFVDLYLMPLYRNENYILYCDYFLHKKVAAIARMRVDDEAYFEVVCLIGRGVSLLHFSQICSSLSLELVAG